ncbi:MAG TPA: YsnF/AvaK domain-containing protein [Candidatus Nitrosocosmicus sp.]
MSSSNKNIDWNKVIKKEAIGVDGLDLGKVHDVRDTYIITQRGFIDKKRYHIPKSSAESFDRDILRLRISESDLQGYEETEDQKFEGYSSFKSSDLSKEQETTIPVMAENLEVSKSIQEDRSKIIKEPITETKTVEIELAGEIITIERRPVNYNAGAASNESYNTESGGPAESRIEISIPLKKEVPVITKKPYVKEEIVVKKKPVTDTKSITEDVTHENIKYDNKLKENDK